MPLNILLMRQERIERKKYFYLLSYFPMHAKTGAGQEKPRARNFTWVSYFHGWWGHKHWSNHLLLKPISRIEINRRLEWKRHSSMECEFPKGILSTMLNSCPNCAISLEKVITEKKNKREGKANYKRECTNIAQI